MTLDFIGSISKKRISQRELIIQHEHIPIDKKHMSRQNDCGQDSVDVQGEALHHQLRVHQAHNQLEYRISFVKGY